MGKKKDILVKGCIGTLVLTLGIGIGSFLNSERNRDWRITCDDTNCTASSNYDGENVRLFIDIDEQTTYCGTTYFPNPNGSFTTFRECSHDLNHLMQLNDNLWEDCRYASPGEDRSACLERQVEKRKDILGEIKNPYELIIDSL